MAIEGTSALSVLIKLNDGEEVWFCDVGYEELVKDEFLGKDVRVRAAAVGFELRKLQTDSPALKLTRDYDWTNPTIGKIVAIRKINLPVWHRDKGNCVEEQTYVFVSFGNAILEGQIDSSPTPKIGDFVELLDSFMRIAEIEAIDKQSASR